MCRGPSGPAGRARRDGVRARPRGSPLASVVARCETTAVAIWSAVAPAVSSGASAAASAFTSTAGGCWILAARALTASRASLAYSAAARAPPSAQISAESSSNWPFAGKSAAISGHFWPIVAGMVPMVPQLLVS